MYSLVLVALLAAAQGGQMTLSQVEAEALANNPEIQSIEQQVRIAESRIPASLAVEDPEFSYRAWNTPLLEPWNVNHTQHMFMLSQKVEARVKRELRYLIADAEPEIQAVAVDAKKLEIQAMVRTAFYRLLRTYDQIRLHHDQVTLADQAVSAARIKYTVGKVPQQDVLKAQIAYARLLEHEVMFQQEADIARADLNTLMGRPADQALEVAGEYPVFRQLPSQAELMETALANRPELRALTLMKSQVERKVRLAEAGYRPDYIITGGYMLMPGGSMNRNALMGEVTITLPWLNRGTHDAEIAAAQSETGAIDAEYRKQVAVIGREIRQALIELDSARRTVELYRDTLRPQALSTLRATVAAYQTDQTDFLNLIDSQSMSIDFQHAFFGALETYEKNIAELERAIGRPL